MAPITRSGRRAGSKGEPVSAVKREITAGEKKINVLRKRRHDAIQGDPAAIAKQHEKGKLSARERIEKLLDPGSLVELDTVALHRNQNFGMADRRIPGDGVVTRYGTIDGLQLA